MGLATVGATNQAREMWVPQCPRCRETNLVLAPANGFTKHVAEKVEVYCSHCSWRGVLRDWITHIYVRL